MIQLEKYSRWIDDKNRLYIIINKWAKIEHLEEGKINYVPTTVDVLDVYKEECFEMTQEYFKQRVEQGLITQLQKPITPT